MHAIDAGHGDYFPHSGRARREHIVRYRCGRCETETDWMGVETVTEAKRGIPCEKCNLTDCWLKAFGGDVPTMDELTDPDTLGVLADRLEEIGERQCEWVRELASERTELPTTGN